MFASSLTLTCLLLSVHCQPRILAIRKDLADLKGTWHVVSVVADGKSAPPEEDVHITYVFDGQHLRVKVDDINEEVVFQIDPSATPRAIDVLPSQEGGAPGRGIYELHDDELRLSLANGRKQRPTDFSNEPGAGRATFVLRRVRPDVLQAEMAKLQGTWALLSGERDGVAGDLAALGGRLVVTGDQFEIRFKDEVQGRGTFTVDVAQSPRLLRLQVHAEGRKPANLLAIYELDGSTLKVCLGLQDNHRPMEFKAPAGSNQVTAELRKQ